MIAAVPPMSAATATWCAGARRACVRLIAPSRACQSCPTDRASSNNRMQATLLSATAATSVFTKTPRERVSFTSEMIVAGAVATAIAASSAAGSRSMPGTRSNAPKTSTGVTVASRRKRSASRRPAFRSRLRLRCAPTVTAIRLNAKCVSGCNPCTASVEKRPRTGPMRIPTRICPVIPGRRARRAIHADATPAAITIASVKSGSARDRMGKCTAGDHSARVAYNTAWHRSRHP